jgi:hypothetical protein
MFDAMREDHGCEENLVAIDHLDPKGYWGDPSGNIRRRSGEQEIIAAVTKECSKTEWNELCRATNLMDKGRADT